jgi:mercuric ion binding protein
VKTNKKLMKNIVKVSCLIGFACVAATPAFAAEKKVTLMFGGKFCESYLGDVETALKEHHGVKSVDVKSMKGHAIVMFDSEKVKGDQLTEAVNGVKGDGWHCTAQVMK